MPPPHFDLLVAEESSSHGCEDPKEKSEKKGVESQLKFGQFPVRARLLFVAVTILTAAVFGFLAYLIFLKYGNRS